MTDTSSIPLSKLSACDGNVRKTAGADTSLAELAASIAAHGLLQSLVVRKDKKGKFAVVAGGRRLAALQQLAESGSIEADYAVPCQVIASDAERLMESGGETEPSTLVTFLHGEPGEMIAVGTEFVGIEVEGGAPAPPVVEAPIVEAPAVEAPQASAPEATTEETS